MRRVTHMKRVIGLAMVLLAFCPALLAQPQFRNAGARLITENLHTNNVVDSGERVTVSLALKNIGQQASSNVIATIQSGNGVSNPFPQSHNYGLLAPCAPSVAREFEFTANWPSNSLLSVNLDLQDSGQELGTVTFRFRIAPQIAMPGNSNSLHINPVGTAAQYPSVLSVSNVPGTIVAVSLTLSNLTHEFPDDVDMLLVSPSGDAVIFMSDAGGGTAFEKETIIFTDGAGDLLPDVGRPPSPIVRPTNYGTGDSFPPPAPFGPYAGVFSAFNGKNANGDWKLFIVDDQPGDDGDLEDGWSLTIATLQTVEPAPILTHLGRTTNNMIRFAVSGRPGYSYALESSPDAFQSLPLEKFIMPPSGTRTFEFPIGVTDQFFRAVTDP